MNEEKKDAYEVGIPLDELPPDDVTADVETNASPSVNLTETDDEPSGLPDLFEPEELAEAGLTAELADAIDDTGSEDLLPREMELPAASTNAPLEIADKDASDAKAFSPPNAEDHAAELPDPDPGLALDLVDASLLATASTAPETEAPDHQEAPVPFTPDDTAGEDRPDIETAMDHDLLVGRLESLSLQMAELQREFEGKLKYDAHKDEIIDRLHSELQEYKQNIFKKYILTVVMDVVKVTDDIRKWLSYFRSLEVSQRDPRKLFRYLEAIPSDLEDVFYWHGVKPFSSQEGAFDPSRQRAIKKVPTGDQILDKQVAHSIRPGYEWETKVIRQEMVAVYVYQEVQESKNTGMIDE